MRISIELACGLGLLDYRRSPTKYFLALLSPSVFPSEYGQDYLRDEKHSPARAVFSKPEAAQTNSFSKGTCRQLLAF